jgi:hypothetical protein
MGAVVNIFGVPREYPPLPPLAAECEECASVPKGREWTAGGKTMSYYRYDRSLIQQVREPGAPPPILKRFRSVLPERALVALGHYFGPPFKEPARVFALNPLTRKEGQRIESSIPAMATPEPA